jgi:hypothetical protein
MVPGKNKYTNILNQMVPLECIYLNIIYHTQLFKNLKYYIC